MKVRNLKSTDEFKYNEDELDKIINKMEKTGYIDFKATDGNNKIVDLLILYANSEYSKKTPKLKELLSSIENSSEFKAGNVGELILIVPNNFIEEKRLVAAINEKKSSETFKNVYVRLCPYSMFIMNMTKKKDIPESRIMTKEEVKNHLDYNRKKPKDISPISEKKEPIIVWLGARKGDFIEEQLLSRNAGVAIAVRRVIQ